MSSRIQRVELLDRLQYGRYEYFIANQPGEVLFHSLDWLRSVKSELNRNFDIVVAYSYADSMNICGALPFFYCRGVLKKTLCSVAYRDHGGVLGDGEDLSKALLDFLIRYAKENDYDSVFLQRKPLTVKGLESLGFVSVDRGIDCVLSLENDRDVYWRKLGGTERWAVRKAKRLGYRIGGASSSPMEKDWVRLIALSRKRLGVPAFPDRFIKRLSEKEAFKVTCLSNANNKCVAVLFWALQGGVAYSLYLGYDDRLTRDRIVDLLYYEAICQAREGGAKVFRFGCDSISQTSLVEYKKKWLAEPEKVESLVWREGGLPACVPDAESPMYDLVRFALKYLPMSAYRWASQRCLRFWY